MSGRTPAALTARRAEPPDEAASLCRTLPGRRARDDCRVRGSRGATKAPRTGSARAQLPAHGQTSADDAPHAFRLSLWTRLGDIAVKRLHDRKLALAAFEAAPRPSPATSPGRRFWRIFTSLTRHPRAGNRRTRSCRAIHTHRSYRALAALRRRQRNRQAVVCRLGLVLLEEDRSEYRRDLSPLPPGAGACRSDHSPRRSGSGCRTPTRIGCSAACSRCRRRFSRPPAGRRARAGPAAPRRPHRRSESARAAAVQLAEVLGLPMPELFRAKTRPRRPPSSTCNTREG